MRATFFNAGSSLSIGVFFSLMIIGLANTLPTAMSTGLQAQGVSASVAQDVANLPPVGSLFAAFLGYNPIAELLAPSGALQEPGVNVDVLTGQDVLPAVDHRAVPLRADRGVHRRRGDDGDRRDRVDVQPGPLRRRARGGQRGVTHLDGWR